jgi:protein-S-isoprenylcysteine O-methyltransferase Ste14
VILRFANSSAGLVTAACWGVFCVTWLEGALYYGRRASSVRDRVASAWTWLLGAAVAWLVFHVVPGTAWHRLTLSDPAWLSVGSMALLLASTAFALWARVVLGTMWSSSVVTRERHVLRTNGPYRLSRHPIYTGLLGMFAGTALVNGLGPWLVVLALASALAAWRIHGEEDLLVRAFPGEYERYRREVPRLIPNPLLAWRALRRG